MDSICIVWCQLESCLHECISVLHHENWLCLVGENIAVPALGQDLKRSMAAQVREDVHGVHCQMIVSLDSSRVHHLSYPCIAWASKSLMTMSSLREPSYQSYSHIQCHMCWYHFYRTHTFSKASTVLLAHPLQFPHYASTLSTVISWFLWT